MPIYTYTTNTGGDYVIHAPVFIDEQQRREIERIICGVGSSECIIHKDEETKNAPLD